MAGNRVERLDAIAKYNRVIERHAGKAVRPFREDGYVNLINRYGTQKDQSEQYRFVAEPEYPDELFTMFYEGNGLFSKIIDTPAEEAVKHGFSLGDVKDSGLVDFYEEALDELDWEETAMTAIKWARLFGGSIAVMLINDGRGLEEPLDWRRIRSIDDIRVYDRSVIQPDYSSLFLYDPHNPFRTRGSRLGMPEWYDVFSRYGSFRVHESRCLTFQNGILPENTRSTTYQMWGIPEYVRIHRAVRDAEIAHGSAPKLLERSIQAIYKMKDLSQELATEQGEEMLLRRLQAIDLARGMMNTMVIDSEGEDYDFKTFPFTGVTDVLSAACNMLSAVTNIPQTILFGQPVGGLSTTDDTAMENYYNFVERIQKRQLRSNLRYLLSVIFQAGVRTGEADEVPKLKVQFNPLWSMSDTEQADLDQKRAQTQQTKAQTAQIYVDMQAVDPSEVRKKLADSEEFDVENMLDEYDDEELFPEEQEPQIDPATGQPIQPPEECVDLEEHNTDPGTEGSTSTAAPAATKLPQDMSAEELEKAQKAQENRDSDAEVSNPPSVEKMGAVGVICVQNGSFLAAKRLEGQGNGLFGGPGGHIERGETPEQAAYRETEEEFGISPKELVLVGRGPKEPETGYTPAIFLCTEWEGEPYPVDGEMGDVMWLPPETLEQLRPSLFPPFADGIDTLMKHLGTFKPHNDSSESGAKSASKRYVDSMRRKRSVRPDGGPGSGNFGHEGREGEVGGSAPAGSDEGGSEHEPVSSRTSPSVKSPKSFDKYVEENGLKLLYRGFSAPTEEDLASRFEDVKSGSSQVSGENSSAIGKGLYFADKESEAEGYMSRRQQETGDKFGRLSTAALDVDAVIGDYREYEVKKFDTEAEMMSKVWSLPPDEGRKLADEAMKIRQMSVPEFAASQGCDAVYESWTGYTVVVNQNALVVRDDSVDSAVSDKILKNGNFPEKPIDKSAESATIKSQSNNDYGVPGMKWGEHKAEEPKKARFKKADYEKVLVGAKTKDGYEIKRFHAHALMRAQSRDVYPSSIKKAIDHPDKIIKGNTGNRSVYIRKGTWVIYDHDGQDIRTVIYKGGK